MSKLDDIFDEFTSTWSLDGIAGSDAWLESHTEAKQQIKDLMLELVSETDFAYKDASAYAEVVKKKIEAL